MDIRLLLATVLLLLATGCFHPPPSLRGAGYRIVKGDLDPRQLSGRELTWAYRSFLELLPRVSPPVARLAVTEKGVEKFSGTRYEAKLRKIATAERYHFHRARFKALSARLRRMSPPERVWRLEAAKLEFAETRYEKTIDRLLERARDVAGQGASQ